MDGHGKAASHDPGRLAAEHANSAAVTVLQHTAQGSHRKVEAT